MRRTPEPLELVVKEGDNGYGFSFGWIADRPATLVTFRWTGPRLNKGDRVTIPASQVASSRYDPDSEVFHSET